jgi:transcriptional regulator with XRE-family HTH domain
MAERIPGSVEMSARIEARMDDLKLRKAHVAARLGVERSIVGRWLKAGGIRDDHLAALATLLETTEEWLLRGRGEKIAPVSERASGAEVAALREAEARQVGGDRRSRRKRA